MRGGLKTVLLMATIAILANRLWMLGVIDLSPATLGESLKQFALKDIHPQIDILVAKVQDLIGGDGGACGWVGTSKFAIVSSRVVTPAGEMPAAVKVREGIIEDVVPISKATLGNKTELQKILETAVVLDYGDSIVAPGLIDVHAHMNEPGRVAWEGFETGTKSASAGGITLAVDMPLNSFPAMTTDELLAAKIAATRGKLYTNLAMWGGLVPANARNPEMLRKMAAGGVIGFKAFLSPSGINDFPNSSIADVAAAMPTLRELGIPVMVHSELVDDNLEIEEGSPRAYATYEATRPPSWERNAIRGLLEALTAEVEARGRPEERASGGFRLHIAHLGDAGSVEMIQEAKRKGLPVTVETCVHYLNFASEEIPDGDTRYKCAPPIRSSSNRQGLWAALEAGALDILSTDHSPAPPEMKKFEEGNFLTAWGGISGLQYALAGTWDGMSKRAMTPSQLTAVWSVAPAKLLGISHITGDLSKGKRADITVWDPDMLADTSRESLLHKHKLTPYQDMKLKGKVLATFVSGHQVFDGAKGVFSQRACGSLVLKEP